MILLQKKLYKKSNTLFNKKKESKSLHPVINYEEIKKCSRIEKLIFYLKSVKNITYKLDAKNRRTLKRDLFQSIHSHEKEYHKA